MINKIIEVLAHLMATFIFADLAYGLTGIEYSELFLGMYTTLIFMIQVIVTILIHIAIQLEDNVDRNINTSLIDLKRNHLSIPIIMFYALWAFFAVVTSSQLLVFLLVSAFLLISLNRMIVDNKLNNG